jgi:hypothetical protein
VTAKAKAVKAINLIIRPSTSPRRDFLEAWIVVPSGSTIVDPDQNGSRRAETAGIAAHFLVK